MRSRAGTLGAQIADLALSAPSRQEFRCGLLQGLVAAIGADSAVVGCAASGAVDVATIHDPEGDRLSRRIARYLEQASASELRTALEAGHALHDDRLFDDRRKAGMRLYHEHLHPQGIRGYLLRLWVARGRMHWLTLHRAGTRWRFDPREVDRLDSVFAEIALGEALHAQPSAGPGADVDSWLADRGLSRAERRVVEYLRRGLSNAEIATALQLSPRTARNHLSAVYRKTEVASRCELMWLLADPEARGLLDEQPRTGYRALLRAQPPPSAQRVSQG
jgi:DNA-binding CsgD family transcriptional regulator